MMQFTQVRAPRTFVPRVGENRLAEVAPFLDAGSAEAWCRRLLRMQAEIIAAGDDLDALLNAVLSSALSLLPKASAAVFDLRDSDALVYRAASGMAAGRIGHRYPLATTLAGTAVSTGRIQICSDTERDSRVDRDACRRYRIRSMVINPVTLAGEIVGTLRVISDLPDALSAADVLTVQLLTGPIVIGLANAARADASEESARLAKRFAATFEQAAVGIAHVAADGSFLRVNDKFCQIAGHERPSLLAGGFQQITHPGDLDADLAHLRALVAGEVESYDMEKRYVRSDRTLAWINLTVSMVRLANGDVDFFVAVIEDISRRKAAELAATHDALTGLPNRRLLLEHLRRELTRRERAGVTVAYLDLDGFKSVNDRLGHAEGDRCLIAVAAALKTALRDEDLVGRLGGDEFAVLLPGACAAAAGPILTRLRDAVAATGIDAGWAISVSIGAVVVDPDGEPSAEAVIEDADRLMYQAKRTSCGTLILEQPR